MSGLSIKAEVTITNTVKPRYNVFVCQQGWQCYSEVQCYNEVDFFAQYPKLWYHRRKFYVLVVVNQRFIHQNTSLTAREWLVRTFYSFVKAFSTFLFFLMIK